MRKFYKAIQTIEDTLTALFLSGVVILTLANVVARYVVKASIPWSQEISGFLWTWTVMLGMSVGYRRNLHYGVEFLSQKLPRKGAIILKQFVYFLMLLTCLFMLYLSITISKAGFVKVSAYFGIPYFYKYISAVIGFAFMVIHTIRYLVLSFKDPEQFYLRTAQGGLPGLDDDEDSEEEGANKA